MEDFTPSAANRNIDLRRLTYNLATGNLDFYLVNNVDAQALHGHYLVAGRAVMHLDPSPGSDEFYRQVVPNPTWVNNQRVTVQLWNEDPDPRCLIRYTRTAAAMDAGVFHVEHHHLAGHWGTRHPTL